MNSFFNSLPELFECGGTMVALMPGHVGASLNIHEFIKQINIDASQSLQYRYVLKSAERKLRYWKKREGCVA